TIISWLCFRFSDAAVRIVDIAEDNCFRRTGLLAGSKNLSVADLAFRIRIRLLQMDFFDLRLDTSGVDALNAECALFHDAAAADRYIRIAHRLQTRRLIIGEQEEVKTPHLIRTVIQAISCPDAAVVNHHVDAFGRMRCSAHRAYWLAGGVLAVLAQHWLEESARIVEIAGEVGVDSQPLHVATDLHLLLADHGTVVLSLTCNHARVASHTR